MDGISFTTKDSGDLKVFGTGAVRNSQEGKGRYDLLPCAAIRRVTGVYERGASIYAPRNWEKGIPMSRCISSALRHTFQHLEGRRDEDHLAQAVFNLLAVIEFDERIRAGRLSPEINDLPPPLDEQTKDPVAKTGGLPSNSLPSSG